MKPGVGSGATFEPMPAGTYPARLYSIIHIGTSPFEYMGETKSLDKVRLTFEFPTKTKVFKEENGEQPYVLSLEFTYSLSERANLRKFLEGWQGKQMTDMEAIDTDLLEWVGKDGLANVVHSTAKNGNTYANIATMSPLPEGLVCPPAVNEPFILNYGEDWDQAKFDSLPQFLKEKMIATDQYQSKFNHPSKTEQKPEEDEISLEDIPF